MWWFLHFRATKEYLVSSLMWTISFQTLKLETPWPNTVIYFVAICIHTVVTPSLTFSYGYLVLHALSRPIMTPFHVSKWLNSHLQVPATMLARQTVPIIIIYPVQICVCFGTSFFFLAKCPILWKWKPKC